MADAGGARTNQKNMATAAGISGAQAAVKSGADLTQAGLLNKASTTAGPGKDGARLEQLAAGE